MAHRLFAVLCLAAGVFMCAFAASAAEGEETVTFRLGIEGGYLVGNSDYRITVPAEGLLLESELVWPLDTALVGAVAAVEQADRWSLGLSVLTNASSVSGVMEDSDWINGIKFIFSESDVSSATFSALVMKLRGGRRIAQFGWGGIDLEGGFLYQRFDLTASDLVQFSPIGIEEFSADVAGPVVSYKVSSAVPHGGLAVTWATKGSFALTGRAHFGYAFVEDEDDHLLRFKISRAETDGPAALAGLEGRYALADRFFFKAGVEYFVMATEGHQAQYFYDGPNRGLAFAGIHNKIDSEQLSALAGVTVLF